MKRKYQDRIYVEKYLGISSRDLDIAIKKTTRKYPTNNWIIKRKSPNGQDIEYFDIEFVSWLEKVYFSKDKNTLDKEINFYKNCVLKLMEEKNINNPIVEYKDMPVKEIAKFLNKGREHIDVAINIMSKEYKNDLKYYIDGKLIIKSEGVEWIFEKYYRRLYLKYLLNLKQALEVGETDA